MFHDGYIYIYTLFYVYSRSVKFTWLQGGGLKLCMLVHDVYLCVLMITPIKQVTVTRPNIATIHPLG